MNIARVAAAHAFGLCVLQALSGAVIVWTHLGLFSTLLHAGVMGLLFAALAAVVRLALRQPGADWAIAPQPEVVLANAR